MTATIRQRNVINEGDQVEFYGPGFRHFECQIQDLHDKDGVKIDRAPNPMELLTITVPTRSEARRYDSFLPGRFNQSLLKRWGK